MNENFELTVIGPTNSGKSTFLHYLTQMNGFFNISPLRETANFWRFKLGNERYEPFKFTENNINNEVPEMILIRHEVDEIVELIQDRR